MSLSASACWENCKRGLLPYERLVDCCPETMYFFEQSPETAVSPAVGRGIRSGLQLKVEEAAVEEESHPGRAALHWGTNTASPLAETRGTWRYGRWKTPDLQAMRRV